MTTKKVTVIIPVHNRLKLLAKALESVRSQTIKDLEVIVVDDASEESVSTVLDSFVEFINIKLVSLKEKSNAATARNIGVQLGSGQYVAFLDSDDCWLPNHVEVALREFSQRNVDIVLGCPRMRKKKESGGSRLSKSVSYLEKRILFNSPAINSSGIVVTKESLFRHEFDEKLNKHQDWDFLLQAHLKGLSISGLNEPTYEWERAAFSRMSSNRDWQSTERFIDKNWHVLSVRAKSRLITHLLRKEKKVRGSQNKDRELLSWLSSLPLQESKAARFALRFECGVFRPARLFFLASKILRCSRI